MARIYPFRALRYNPSLVRVEDCVTQPYDKISPSMQQAYYQKSPYNLVRIILGLPELFDGKETGDVYTRAARDFADWRESGVLAQESEPCVFAYSQKFTVPGSNGKVLERRGFIGLGGLHDYSENVVFRHEQTLSKPKSDRLNLLRATRAHFGQIFMLYSDPGLTAEKLLFDEDAIPDFVRAPHLEADRAGEIGKRVVAPDVQRLHVRRDQLLLAAELLGEKLLDLGDLDIEKRREGADIDDVLEKLALARV